MKAEIEIPDNLVPALDFMAECEGQTPDEYLQERVILYLQDWLYHIKDPNQGITLSICGHYGGTNLVTAFDIEEEPTDSITPLQRCPICSVLQSQMTDLTANTLNLDPVPAAPIDETKLSESPNVLSE